MAITDENMVLPVQPLYGGGNYGNNGGFFGGGDSWLGILFLIALLNGGWGGFGGFGGGYGAMMGMGMMDGGFGLYPWLNNSQNISGGFRDQMLNTSVNGIQNSITSGFGDVQTALCGGFAGVNQNISSGTAAIQNSLCNGFNGVNTSINTAQNALAQQMYSNQLSDLERSFAAQTASTQGMNAIQAQLAQCGCDNRAATADLKYTIATENCADRAALSDGIRDVIASNTAQTQAILDKLCALELDGVKSQLAQAQRENVALQNQVNMATMQASQTAQTAQILAGQAAEIDGVYNRLKNCPVGTYPVCNPLTPPYSQSCGCGA